MHGYEIIQELASFLSGDEVIVSSTGNISRQVYNYLPQPQIYLRGSMGLAIPVGLGYALTRPEKQVLVISGDGSLLMGFGSLVTTSFIRPSNLKILILDNNTYATTGPQSTTSGILDYSALLDGLRFPKYKSISLDDTKDEVRDKLQLWLNSTELGVLPALVSSKPPNLENIPWHPEEITELILKKE